MGVMPKCGAVPRAQPPWPGGLGGGWVFSWLIYFISTTSTTSTTYLDVHMRKNSGHVGVYFFSMYKEAKKEVGSKKSC